MSALIIPAMSVQQTIKTFLDRTGRHTRNFCFAHRFPLVASLVCVDQWFTIRTHRRRRVANAGSLIIR